MCVWCREEVFVEREGCLWLCVFMGRRFVVCVCVGVCVYGRMCVHGRREVLTGSYGRRVHGGGWVLSGIVCVYREGVFTGEYGRRRRSSVCREEKCLSEGGEVWSGAMGGIG